MKVIGGLRYRVLIIRLICKFLMSFKIAFISKYLAVPSKMAARMYLQRYKSSHVFCQ